MHLFAALPAEMSDCVVKITGIGIVQYLIRRLFHSPFRDGSLTGKWVWCCYLQSIIPEFLLSLVLTATRLLPIALKAFSISS